MRNDFRAILTARRSSVPSEMVSRTRAIRFSYFSPKSKRKGKRKHTHKLIMPFPQEGALLRVFPNYSAEEQINPKLSNLKQQILSHNFCGQESPSRLAQISWLKVSYKALVRSSTGTAVISRFKWGRSASKFTHMLVGRIQCLQALGLRVSALLWLLTEGPSWVSCHEGLPQGSS